MALFLETDRSSTARTSASHIYQNSTRGTKYTLDSLRYWDVKISPTKVIARAGTMIPTLRGTIPILTAKERRISVEVYYPQSSTEKVSSSEKNFKTFERRALATSKSFQKFDELMTGISKKDLLEMNSLGDNDLVIFRVFKEKKATGESDDDDSIENSEFGGRRQSLGKSLPDMLPLNSTDGLKDSNTWEDRFRIRLCHLVVVSAVDKSCKIKFHMGDKTMIRTMYFKTMEEFHSFLGVIHVLKGLQLERAERLADAYTGKVRNLSEKDPLSAIVPKKKKSGLVPFAVKLKDTAFEGILDGSKTGKQFLSWGNSSRGPSLGDKDEENYLPMKKKDKTRTRVSQLAKSVSAFLSGGDETNQLTRRHVDLLVEIVSAYHVPICLKSNKSDPYVKVYDGKDIIHKTKNISNTLNPVWSLSTGSLFLLRQNAENFFETNYLDFEIRDYDPILADTALGRVSVGKHEMLNGKGKRVEYPFEACYGSAIKDPAKQPVLSLRFRLATAEDIEFMNMYQRNQSKIRKKAVYASDCFIPPKVTNAGLKLQVKKRVKNGELKILTMPYPDPDDPVNTKWLTVESIQAEVWNPSKNWIEAGSGSLGKIYCEVLKCSDLPNLDIDITGRNKTDPFVCLVYEDAIVHTDVLDDFLSPHWLPWTQRAFVLNIMDPNSQINIGVFDYDTADPKHDVVGRTVCNVTNFCPGTTYTVTYDLFAFMKEERRKRGTITLRIRIEWKDERVALLAGFSFSRKPHHVVVDKKSLFHTVHYTVTNEESPHMLRINTISKYINELWQYYDYTPVEDYMRSLIFWHFHYPLPIPFCKIKPIYLPLRSMVAFAWGIALSQNFELIPSFLAFSVAWILIASLDLQYENPSPWHRPRPYWDLLCVLLFNKSAFRTRVTNFDKSKTITEYELAERAAKEAQQELEGVYYQEQDKYFSRAEKESRNLQGSKSADLEIATQVKGDFSDKLMETFGATLLPVQTWLYWICRNLRIIKSIMRWRDSYAAFWIVTASVLSSFIFLWIPWSHVLKVLFQILVYTFLGPWMKLVDIYYCRYKPFYKRSVHDVNEDKERDLQRMRETWSAWSDERKLEFEKVLKEKDMKEYMFGKFLVKVPVMKDEPDYHFPLVESTAVPNSDEELRALNDINIVQRKFGQLLQGDMIPKILKGRQLEEDTIQFETLEATEEVGKSDAAIALARTPWQGIRNSISAKYTRRVNLQDVGVGKLQQFLARYGNDDDNGHSIFSRITLGRQQIAHIRKKKKKRKES